MKLKLKKYNDRQWYFTMVSKNGRVIMTSETYRSKQGAMKSMALVAGSDHWKLYTW